MSEQREYERIKENPSLTVKPGENDDTCPLCGIHRQNAGFVKESCGDGYLKPDCFVQRVGGAVT